MGMEKGKTASFVFDSGLRAYPFGFGTRFLSNQPIFVRVYLTIAELYLLYTW